MVQLLHQIHGALTIPVGTTAQRPSSPENGMMRYNTDTGFVESYSTVGGWFNTGDSGKAVSIEYLVVGGGGAAAGSGNHAGGGGGAGGFITSKYFNYYSWCWRLIKFGRKLFINLWNNFYYSYSSRWWSWWYSQWW
jgi:hypothetical protein